MKFPGIETTILLADAKRGILYASFEDFWTRRLASRQIFFPKDCKGPLKDVRDAVRSNTRECWDQFAKAHPEFVLPPASQPAPPAHKPADGCGGSPQAGGAHPLPAAIDPRSSEPLYD